MPIMARFWQWSEVPTITTQISGSEGSIMLPTRHQMQMGHPPDGNQVQPSNHLCTAQPSKWDGIPVWLFLTHKHSSPMGHQQVPRKILCIILQTIAHMVTQITTVGMHRPPLELHLLNHKTLGQSEPWNLQDRKM